MQLMFMLSDTSAATDAGRIAGEIFVWVALLAGVLKCWSISQRPATNTKCAVSLMLVLLSFVYAGCAQEIMRKFAPSPGLLIVRSVVGLGMIGMLVTSIVLAILGLVEFSSRRELYAQGRAQAIWTLALGGILCLTAGVGFINGLLRSNSFIGGQSQPGKILAFDEFNFRFRSPERPWVSLDAYKLNRASKVAFMRHFPEAYFFIIPEKMGMKVNLDTAQLAEAGEANLQAAATSSRVESETPWQIGRLDGLLVEMDAQVGSFQLHYHNWYCATNGYAYQLIGYSRSEDQQTVARELADMISRFELIDPNRVASFSSAGTTNFESPRHDYTVILTNSPWHSSALLEKNFPQAEFNASVGDSCFVILPVNIKGEDINLDALTSAFLATMGISYPNEDLTDREPLAEGNLTGKQFDFSRDVNGLAFHYRFKILQGTDEAYMVAAWTQRREVDTEAVLNDMFSRVRFESPPFAPQMENDRERKARAFVLNQCGLYYSRQDEFEQALPLYQAAVRANDQDSIFIINALETWENLDRPLEALSFLNTQPASVLSLPKVKASQAFFQAKAMLTDQAITNYGSLFDSGYRSDVHFVEYINLLAGQKEYDAALTAVQNYLKKGDSVAARLSEAQIYRLKQNFPKAIEVLAALRRQAPYNDQIASSLADTFLTAGRYSEALEISRQLVNDNSNSAQAKFTKGRSELGLKWYREAKISLSEAAKLAPANKDIRSYLDYVSGLLGEGDNTAIMDPIDPVAVPDILTASSGDPVPVGYATNYGAYYVRRIVAVSYTPAKENKTTESVLVKILDASGVSAFSTVQVEFDPLSEQLFINDVRVMDADGTTISTGNPANYYVLDDRSVMGDSQKKVLNIPIPGLQPGSQLAVTLTRRQEGHLNGFPFLAHTFALAVPARAVFFFLAGDCHDLKYCTSPAMEPEKIPEGLYWRVADPMVARWETLQPPAASFLPMLWISDAAEGWQSSVSNYLGSISDRLEPDPALQTRVQVLVGKLDNADAKIALLASYVQTNLTYKAIEFGRRARIPNRPADIMQNKYGDCKDHAVLLQQMLVAAGVPASLALVSHRGPIQTNQPSLDQFDHMLVYVPTGGGRFLDCTDKGAEVAHAIPMGLAGRVALILDNRNARFVAIPKYPENASSISVVQHIHLVDQTDLTVEESFLLSGVHAAYMRGYLLQVPESSRRTTLQTMMGMTDADLTDLEVDSLNEPGKPLRLRFAYSIKRQFRRSGNELRGFLRAGFARSYLAASPSDERLTPFELTIPFSFETSVVVDAPTGYQSEQPESMDLKLDPRFATGEGSARAEGGQLRLDFKCRQKTGEFAAADYGAYRQTMAQALSFLEREVVFNANEH
jgi:tetratricopeptide (TPR) repeat protein